MSCMVFQKANLSSVGIWHVCLENLFFHFSSKFVNFSMAIPKLEWVLYSCVQRGVLHKKKIGWKKLLMHGDREGLPHQTPSKGLNYNTPFIIVFELKFWKIQFYKKVWFTATSIWRFRWVKNGELVWIFWFFELREFEFSAHYIWHCGDRKTSWCVCGGGQQVILLEGQHVGGGHTLDPRCIYPPPSLKSKWTSSGNSYLFTNTVVSF